MNSVECWKAKKHGFDVWPDLVRHAAAGTPLKEIPAPDLDRLKWYGTFYRRRDGEGSYMLRIRIPGCELTADQAEAIAGMAEDLGYGIVDVTTRSSFQVQGLALRDVPAALERLASTGLTTRQTGHDNVRNVFCHPLSGIDPDELIDTRGLAREISHSVIGNREMADLPRKFNIALCGRADAGIGYWTQDLSYLAHRRPSGAVAFHLLVAGKQGQDPKLAQWMPISVAPSQVVAVTKACLELFREKGAREQRDRTRFAYLFEKIGVEGLLEHLQVALGGELLTAEKSGVGPPSPFNVPDDFVGWFRQKQPGRWTLGVAVPVGRMMSRQLAGLAEIARTRGDGTLRTTPSQSILIPNLATNSRAAIAVARYGLSPEADSITRNVIACTGKQFCNIGVTETKGIAFRLMEQLRTRGVVLQGIRIQTSGCPAACAQHHTADIGLKGVRVRRRNGTHEGFDVFLGGGGAQLELGRPYKSGVDFEQLPQIIEEVVQTYFEQVEGDQSFSLFWRERLDSAIPDKLTDDDYRPDAWLCESCGYLHAGTDPPIFCPKCSALRREFARLEDEQDRLDRSALSQKTA